MYTVSTSLTAYIVALSKASLNPANNSSDASYQDLGIDHTIVSLDTGGLEPSIESGVAAGNQEVGHLVRKAYVY
jgi:hypothetical protein